MTAHTRQILAGLACGMVCSLYILSCIIFCAWIGSSFTADIALGGISPLILTFAYAAAITALWIGFFHAADNINQRLYLVPNDSDDLFFAAVIISTAAISAIGFFLLQSFLASLM